MFIPDRDKKGNLILYTSPFSNKAVNEGTLFRRVHGVTTTLAANGDTVVELVIPYNKCKINAAEILWCPEGVTIDFEVFDTPTGTIQLSLGVPQGQVIPSKKLNQFGFGVCIAKDEHKDQSEYDADLIKDMKIKATFHNSTDTSKTIGVNFVLHEVV